MCSHYVNIGLLSVTSKSETNILYVKSDWLAELTEIKFFAVINYGGSRFELELWLGNIAFHLSRNNKRQYQLVTTSFQSEINPTLLYQEQSDLLLQEETILEYLLSLLKII